MEVLGVTTQKQMSCSVRGMARFELQMRPVGDIDMSLVDCLSPAVVFNSMPKGHQAAFVHIAQLAITTPMRCMHWPPVWGLESLQIGCKCCVNVHDSHLYCNGVGFQSCGRPFASIPRANCIIIGMQFIEVRSMQIDQ